MMTYAPGRTAPSPTSRKPEHRFWAFWLVTVLLLVSSVGSFGYAGFAVYMATQIVHQDRMPLTDTPTSYGLRYQLVTFPSREDKVPLRGWLIPGVLPDGRLTTDRTIVVIHGKDANRADDSVGMLAISAGLAYSGFAVLAFDLRGNGESPVAPRGFGYYEWRDVLGAVDFLRSGPVPYPELGRPRIIGGLGVSLGAVSLLLAAARQPAIQAVVSDDAFATVMPIMEREIPMGGGARYGWPSAFTQAFTPGALVAVHVLYGIDYDAVRPVDVVAKIAPRPIFFIHPDADPFIVPANFTALVTAASTVPNAHVQSWLVPGVNKHPQSYNKNRAEYMRRVTRFFAAALGPDQSRTTG